ncbi:MAG: 30S ribosomal protein S12 methylthiotransferase RimO [Gemmatimonadales bacterium]|nr:MAG: 30S ribosomal protein S12 methylthiotransferase RimO [Gemmatimonadales bacterium]
MSGRVTHRDLPVFPVSPPSGAGGAGEGVRSARGLEGRLEAVGQPEGPRIGLVTLGCDKNTVDSERMMASLVGHGARVTTGVEGARIVIVNTCGFIEAAREQSVETILEACALKEAGGVDAVVAVGCMVQRYGDELAREIPEVDLFMGITDMPRLVPELQDRGFLPDPETLPNMERPLRLLSTETSHTSFLKISEGCDHTCAFCAIPHMRGLHRSVPVAELVAEARELEAAGVRELNIISQDTTWYGRDLRRAAVKAAGPGGTPDSVPLLPDLLRALLAGTEVPWFRLFYMYPSGITPELVELLASEPRILPYLDLPIQHGSDAVLRRMRRPERQETIRQRVRDLRESIPGIVLRTTVIVGFPGETDAEFEDMMGLLEELAFDRVGAFTYSPEEGTPAAEMAEQVPESVKRERLEALMDLQRGISWEANEALVGRVEALLVDRLVDDDPEYVAEGRIRGQAIDVDGLTRILPDEAARTLRPGDLVPVRIEDALEYDLVARVVPPPEPSVP